jgi:hypothetical protein
MFSQFTLFPKIHREFSWRLYSRWLMLLCLASPSFKVYAEQPVASDPDVEIGRRIYIEGILPSGKPLQGKRMDAVQLEGTAAACETCHRRSGMGSLEGNIVVTPINGRFLFATTEDRPIALMDQRAPKNVTRAHEPYTDASFAKVLHEGINVDGKAMNPLMPKYDLNATEIKALMAYLRQLSAEVSPGVGTDTVHFATIVTPDVDSKKKEAMISMMRASFAQRNASQQAYSGRMRMPIDLIPRTLRNWELSVWELTGTPDTWGAQLEEQYRKQPVFAVISGISNTTWEPVHKFCQSQKLPCMLPSVTLPPAETGYYSIYYTRGVALEADVLAKYIRNQEKKAPQRLFQVYRDNEVERSAAKVLTDALSDSGVKVENRIISGNEPSALKKALKDVSSKDAVMLWLNPSDLLALNKAEPQKLPAITYISGFLANESYSFVSKAWEPQVRVVYPYDLGGKRRGTDEALQSADESRQVVEESLKKWLQTWQLPVVDVAFQSEVFFNLLFLTDISSQMIDNLYRDYMIERAEDMLSLGSNVSIYPHLSLARGQRFASKGAYIAHFGTDGKLVAESDWLVP